MEIIHKWIIIINDQQMTKNLTQGNKINNVKLYRYFCRLKAKYTLCLRELQAIKKWSQC